MLLRNLSIGPRLHVMVVVMLAAIVVVAWSAVAEMHDRLLAERRDRCRLLVEVAVNHMQHLVQQVAAGTLAEDEAKRRAIEDITSHTSDGDYLWVTDRQPVALWHPMTQLIGRNVGDILDSAGRPIFREFVAATARQDSVFIAYSWPHLGGGPPAAKLSYVQRFAPWDWVVGSGVYIDDVEAINHQAVARLGVITAVAAAVAAAVAGLLGRSVTGPLAAVIAAMERLASDGPAAPAMPAAATDGRDEVAALARTMAVFRRGLEEREDARRAREFLLREIETVFEHMSEGVMVTDTTNRITRINASFTRITGYTVAEAVGADPSILASGRHDRDFYRAMWQGLAADGEWQGEVWNRTKAGEVYPESLSITAIHEPGGQVAGYVATFLDITNRKRREARIRWRAERDQLTGLFNRAHFEARLADAVRVARAEGGGFTLLFIDLDGFKPINDRYGHAAGDAVLRQVAKRLRNGVRADDVVGRLGGDEFTVLVPNVVGTDGAGRIAEKILAALAQPYLVNDHTVTIGASIGIALHPAHGDEPEDLIRNADGAMYAVKERGRNGYAFAGGGRVHLVTNWADAEM